uniref:TAFA chemokine like family member 5 n=1 Tax=Felis catus TaxID=9685 RepID=A0ABI7Z4C4_FELCA
MAPSPRTGSRQDATALPSMSSTFWAFMILASLLIAYCSQLAAGTCEIVTLDRDSSQPRRTIARQTARCACRKGQIAGTTRARPACVDARIIKTKQWCDMLPCLEGEGCDLLINRSGWTCTQPGGRIKTTTDEMYWPIIRNVHIHSKNFSLGLFRMWRGRRVSLLRPRSLAGHRGWCW